MIRKIPSPKEIDLKENLNSLDIDEGIRIESKTINHKIFINKKGSGFFAVQISKFGSEEDKDLVSFYENVYQLINLIKSIFGKGFSFYLY